MSLLDLSGGHYGHSLSELPLYNVATMKDFDFTLDISNNGIEVLGFLATTPRQLQQQQLPQASLTNSNHQSNTAHTASLLRQVQVLVAQTNALQHLGGVNTALPNLIVLDVTENFIEELSFDSQFAISQCKQLDTLILATNALEKLPFHFAAADPSISLLANLRVLDLSGNNLSEIPNVAHGCPNLVTLDLSGNNITRIGAHGGQRLACSGPGASATRAGAATTLQQLFLRDNKIEDWWRLPQLTTVADSLAEVDVSGNVFCSRVRFSWRIFVGWLLPVCAASGTIDGTELNDHERDALDNLFRDDASDAAAATGGDAFSLRLLGLMDEGRVVELEEYLNGACRVAPRRTHTHGRSSAGAKPSPARVLSLGGGAAGHSDPYGAAGGSSRTSSREPFADANNAGGGGGGTNPSNATTLAAVAQLQDKVRALQGVVKVLRQQDLKNRNRAAITIQKWWRGYFARRHLVSREAMRRLHALKRRSTLARNGGGSSAAGAKDDDKKNHKAAIKELQEQVKRLTMTVATLVEANEMQLQHENPRFSRICAAIENRSAKLIQCRWRGFLARRRFAEVRAAYKKFALRFEEPAIRIQATFRMYAQRKRFLVLLRDKRERQQLLDDTRVIKARLVAMERALQALLSRVETVEQLALLDDDDGNDDSGDGKGKGTGAGSLIGVDRNTGEIVHGVRARRGNVASVLSERQRNEQHEQQHLREQHSLLNRRGNPAQPQQQQQPPLRLPGSAPTLADHYRTATTRQQQPQLDPASVHANKRLQFDDDDDGDEYADGSAGSPIDDADLEHEGGYHRRF